MNRWQGLAALTLLGVLLRAVLLLDYPAQLFPDSYSYLQAARELFGTDWSIGQGRRTPGYPLLIALVGTDPSTIVLAQMAIGLLTAALLFDITWRLTGCTVTAFAVGASLPLNLQQLFMEGGVVTEPVSAFGVVLALWAFVLCLERLRLGRLPAALLVATSVLAAYALLVRPQFLFLPALMAVLALWVVWRERGTRALPTGLTAAALLAAPAVALVLAWAATVQARVGPFTMSTQSGFGMVNHVIDYIEDAPPQYAVVRDVLLRTREARIAQVGHSRNTIWYAWPEIQRSTGWTLPQASRELQRMCAAMFAAQPLRYARSVFSAWADFWTVPIFWEPSAIRPALQPALETAWWIEHKGLRLANLAFVVLSVAVLLVPGLRRRLHWDSALTAIVLTVWGSSLIQALADQGASSRYHLPTQALVLLVLGVALARWRGARAAFGR